MDSANTERLKELLEQEIDWSYLQRLAHQHRVMPLLYQNLRATHKKAVSRTILDPLKQQYISNTGHNLSLTRELLKLMSQFESHGIRAIAYKGPVLAASIYGNIALRQFSDLDILVDTHDFPRSTNLLVSLGYQRMSLRDWESSFSNANGTMAVDLHRGIVPRKIKFPLEFDRLWERRISTLVLGRTVSGLSIEDMLVVLCIQAVKDGWEQKYQLSKVCDINELIQAHPTLDWGQVLTHCERLDCQRMLFLGLSLAHDFLDMPLPEDVMEKTQCDQNVAYLTKKIREQFFFTLGYQAPSRLEEMRFHAKLREKQTSKISFGLYIATHFIHRLIVPNEDDRAFVTLPPYLNFVYYIVRPVRLLRNYGLRLSGKLVR